MRWFGQTVSPVFVVSSLTFCIASCLSLGSGNLYFSFSANFSYNFMLAGITSLDKCNYEEASTKAMVGSQYNDDKVGNTDFCRRRTFFDYLRVILKLMAGLCFVRFVNRLFILERLHSWFWSRSSQLL